MPSTVPYDALATDILLRQLATLRAQLFEDRRRKRRLLRQLRRARERYEESPFNVDQASADELASNSVYAQQVLDELTEINDLTKEYQGASDAADLTETKVNTILKELRRRGR